MRTAPSFALLATVLAPSLFSAPAPTHAATRDRTFVASYGNDSGTCTFGSPCKTFQFAYEAVAVGGEVTAIDSAGFGPLNITTSVTITSPAGVEAGIQAAAGANAITINAPGSSVVLSGLTLNGAGVGLYGIEVTSAANLEVVNCAIRGFTDSGNINLGGGIVLYPTTQMNFLISNTIVADNTFGIYYQYGGSSISGSIKGVIDHVVTTNNLVHGISILSLSIAEPTYVTISNTTSSNNGNDGLLVQDDAAVSRFIVDVDLSYFNNNTGNGIEAYGVGSSSVVLLGRSVITGNGAMGISYTSSTFATYGDNRINWNGTGDVSAPLDTTDDTVR